MQLHIIIDHCKCGCRLL